MIVGVKNHYSYGFYKVGEDFYIYDLSSGKMVDKFVSFTGSSEREEILHHIFEAKKPLNYDEILSAHKGLYYLFMSKRDKFLINLAQKAIKRMRKIA